MHIKRVAQREGQRGRGPKIWCGSEPIICTNLFGLIDATAARFVSSFWLPHKVAALWRAKKSIKHFNFSSCFSRREPLKEETRATRVTGATMGTCQLCLSNAHFVFSFLFFVLSRKGESSSGALSFSMPSNPCLLLSYKLQ